MEGPYFYNTLVKNKISKYIIDEHNVYWEMKAFPSYNINDKLYNMINSKRDKYLEIKALKNALHIFVCSFADKEKILNEIPNIENNISIIPNCINYGEFKNNDHQTPQKENNKKYKILFMGLLSYAPNVDAVHSICRYIAPKVSNADFYIVGRDPPKVNKPDNVKFLGYVDDIRSYINNSDVCLAPLKYGSGTRFKILEYMAMGKPIISTSKGAEGIDYTNNVDIYIEDDITKFADRLKDFFLDDEYLKIGLNARNLVRTKYDWDIYKSYINNVYKNILEN
jgi:glycosyltransferase involved in cell wall biosynthesis